MTSSSSTYLTQLHELLNEHFGLADIRDLCFRLDVDYESVAGDEKPSRIRELLLALGRNGRLPNLITLAQKLRPKVDWPPVPDGFQLPESLTRETAVPANQYHVYGDVVHGDKIGGDKVIGSKIVYKGLSTEEVANLVVELKHKDQPNVWDGRIPYLGLTVFQESNAEFFFGRESLVKELLERVKQSNFITIAGPSGSGKSSVARAGLFHALRTGAIETSDRWLLATMQPKGDPFGQLALAMERATKSTAVGDALYPDNQPTSDLLLRQIQMHLSEDSRERCVLLVDQFEELFTQTKDTAVQTAFINLLTKATQTPESRFIVVLSLRSEFVSQCASFPKLRELMSQQFQLVGGMEPQDLAKAITLPAMEVGSGIDPALVSRIVTDMKGEPGALPLMSFALRDLFEAEKTKRGTPMALTLAGYLQRGGIDRALEQHADTVFATFADEQKDLAKGIFSKLIEVGHGRVDTRRTATLQELIPADSNKEAVMTVIAALTQEGARLITTSSAISDGEIGQEETTQVAVTLAHEKLIDAWPWLRRLVDENRETIALQNQINNDAQVWSMQEDSSFLYQGGRLIQVEEKLELLRPNLDVLSQRFIQVSLASEKQRQRTRRFVQIGGGIVLAVLVMLSIGAALINSERNVAVEARETAVAAQATSDANAIVANKARATAEIGATTESEARSTAVNAQETAVIAQSTAQADATRANIAEATAIYAQGQIEKQQEIVSLLVESQSIMDNGFRHFEDISLARLMTVAAEKLDELYRKSINSYLTHPWSFNLTQMVDATYRPFLIFEDIQSSPVYTAIWNQEGTLLASGSCNERNENSSCIEGLITIWDVIQQQPLTNLYIHSSEVTSLAWSHNGKYLASGDRTGNIIIWEVNSLSSSTFSQVKSLTAHENLITDLSWRPDNSQLASSSEDSSIIIWDAANWEQVIKIKEHDNGMESVVWSPDSKMLASASCGNRDEEISCSVGEIEIWNTDSWIQITALNKHQGTVNDITWSPDGNYIASASNDYSIIIWNVINWETSSILSGHDSSVNSVDWSPSGDRIASSGGDNRILIWKRESDDFSVFQPPTILQTDDIVNSSITNATWSPNGSQLVSVSGKLSVIASQDRKIRVWDTDIQETTNTFSNHKTAVTDVAWNSDDTLLASTSCGEWNSDGQCIESEILISANGSSLPEEILVEHSDWVRDLEWSPSNEHLASASDDSEIIIWDTINWHPIITLTEHQTSVRSVSWSPNNDFLASSSCGEIPRDRICFQGEIIIWDVSTWEPIMTISDAGYWITGMEWSPDGTKLATTTWDGVYIWDTMSWEKESKLIGSWVWDVSWKPDGSQLAYTDSNSGFRVWETNDWEQIVSFGRDMDATSSLDWNSAGNYLATTLCTSRDRDSECIQGTVNIWDTSSWNKLATFNIHSEAIINIEWANKSDFFATGSTDKTVSIIDYNLNDRNCDLAGRNFTWDEWQLVFPNEPYQIICSQWPVHPSVPQEAWPES